MAQTREVLTPEKLKSALSKNNINPLLLSRISLKTVDDNNHFLVTVVNDSDLKDVENITDHLMNLVKDDKSEGGGLEHLYRVVGPKNPKFLGYTVATLAAGSVNNALYIILDNLPACVKKEKVDAELEQFANHKITEGRWNGFHMVHFAAMRGEVKKLKTLHQYGADMTVLLPDHIFKKRFGGACGGWSILDIAIRQWSKYTKENQNATYVDIIKYYVPFIRQNKAELLERKDIPLKKSLSLDGMLKNISRTHTYLSKEQSESLERIIRDAYSYNYVPLESKKRKRARNEKPEEKKETREPKSKRLKSRLSLSESPAPSISSETNKKHSKSSHATMTLAMHKQALPMETDVESTQELEEKNATLTATLAKTKAKLAKRENELAEFKIALAEANSALNSFQGKLVESQESFDARIKRACFNSHAQMTRLAEEVKQCSALQNSHAEVAKEVKELKTALGSVQDTLVKQGNEIAWLRENQRASPSLFSTNLPDTNGETDILLGMFPTI